MAINATIQVRRGLLKDFDPTKMLPGEWAVSIDSSTSNQIVWMCFAPGVCKRMGTYEDFQNMVYNATGQIIERYEDAFGSILEEVNTNAEAVSANTDIVLVAKSDIINTYLPQIRSYVSNASASASEAKTYSENAKASASEADKSAEDAKKYSQNAFSTTPEGYEALVGDVDVLKNSIIQTTDRTLYGSKEGGIKLIGIEGASEQKQYSGKNLLDLSTLTETTSNGVTFTPIFENSMLQYILVNGTATAQARYYFPSGLTFETDTILSLQGATNGGVSGYASGMNVFVEEKTITANTSYGTFFLFVNEGSAVSNIKIYPMISVEGGDYEPFVGGTASPNPIYPQEIESVGDSGSLGIKASNEDSTKSKSITIPLNEPLRGIGEVKDEVVCQDGVWGVLRRIKEIVFDGDEGWFMATTMGTDKYRCYTEYTKDMLKGANDNDSLTNSLCTIAIGSAPNKTFSCYEGFSVATSGSLVVYTNEFNTADVDIWRSYLSENPMIFISELATPTFEPFTDQTPFYGLESFDTVTYISTDSEVEPSIELKFAKTEGDAVTLLNYNQTNLNRIAIAELTSAVLALNQE